MKVRMAFELRKVLTSCNSSRPSPHRHLDVAVHRHRRLSYLSENPRRIVFASNSFALAFERALSGMGCREPSLSLGRLDFHPARLRAPLAMAA